jgi:hypothetical protein
MNVEVRQAGKEEQNQIEALLNDYLAELSQHLKSVSARPAQPSTGI